MGLNNADMLNINPEKIIIAGDSAGGNLALAVTLMARDRGLRMPDAELLIYPATDRRMITGSMKKYVDTPLWNANLTKIMWKEYLGDQQPERIEYASPIEAESFEGFPRYILKLPSTMLFAMRGYACTTDCISLISSVKFMK